MSEKSHTNRKRERVTVRDVEARLRLRLLALVVLIGGVTTLVWSNSHQSYFWPGWVWLGLAVPYLYLEGVLWAIPRDRYSGFGVHATVATVTAAVCWAVWWMAGGGYLWPLWPMVGLAIGLIGHTLFFPPRAKARERQLENRVDALTESRQSVLEVQEAELRRVERDLHDGAQARLVALGMSLGMAEQILASDPDAARRLLGEARSSAGEALSDLRHLVRGIRPPALADRGLEGAIRALLVTVPMPVEVSFDLDPESLPDPLESALYFAAAELIANVVKHSGASRAWIHAEEADGKVSIAVGDDGAGGAALSESGGLGGVRRRVAAFDGKIEVFSPEGGPTVVRVEVPCELLSPKI